MGLGTDLTYVLGAALTSPVWGFRMARTGKWRTDWLARFGRGEPLPQDARRTVLIHGVSVGEIASIAPIVEALESQRGDALRTVVSATTDTGLARAHRLYGNGHPVVRYPFDLSHSVRGFLDRTRPDIVALTELEVWPNFAETCRERAIPMVVISGRLSDRSFRRYQKIRRWVRPLFAQLEAVGAQTQEYADRFIALGARADRVQVTDSTKWDAAPRSAESADAHALAAALGIDRERPLVVAGSTGPGEERLLLDEIEEDVQLLIAPRKPERFNEVSQLDRGFVRRSEHPDGGIGATGATRFLLDTLGELETAYALADVVVVGRSFVPMGGSDPISPVALGRPTVVGPHHDNFRDAVSSLAAAGVLRVVDRPGSAVREILDNPDEGRRMRARGPEVIDTRRGAAKRTLALILEALERKQ